MFQLIHAFLGKCAVVIFFVESLWQIGKLNILNTPVDIEKLKTPYNFLIYNDKLYFYLMNLNFFLLSLNVENKWKQEQSINWLTGETITDIDKINKLDSYFTHCSSFVSSVCIQLNIPFLTPPEARTEGLANRQCQWLTTKGITCGWTEITKLDIEKFVKQNYLIVACQYSTNNPNCGHVAIVVDIVDNIVYVCQAGKINSSNISVCEAFCCPESIQYWLYNRQL